MRRLACLGRFDVVDPDLKAGGRGGERPEKGTRTNAERAAWGYAREYGSPRLERC